MTDFRAGRTIVVAGGGITGLSAAYYAKKLLEERRIDANLVLVEKSDRLGGKIATLRRDGYVVEQGPDSFLARKPQALSLIKDLGLEEQLTAADPEAKANYIWRKGKLHRMPMGLVLGVPTKLAPMVETKLISPAGKLRAAMDLLLPRRGDAEDESLGGFIRRRLGREVLENITEPLLAGIYAGDTEFLSLESTFPQFRQMEREHRSLILGLLASRNNGAASAPLPDIARKSLFLTFERGLSVMIERLTESLRSIRTITGQGVARLDGTAGRYKLLLDRGTELTADGVILALPAFEAARLLSDVPEADGLEGIPYASVANVALAYRREEVGFPMNGSGFVVPRTEGKQITACTWASSKWPHAAPKDGVLLRAYVGRSTSQEWTRLTDEELLAGVRADLKETMGIAAEPLFSEIARCHRSMPQYPIGHRERLRALRSRLEKEKPGVWLCGAGYEGVGIPDCIGQGQSAAERMVAYCAGAAWSE